MLAAGTASAVLLLGYGILAVMAFGLAACVYLLPMAIAVRRSHPNAIAIARQPAAGLDARRLCRRDGLVIHGAEPKT